MSVSTERRIVRGMRDEAAYRIAEAVADGQKPGYEHVSEFRRYRQKHIDLTNEMVAERNKEAGIA